jgi:signal transduction histidine kinase
MWPMEKSAELELRLAYLNLDEEDLERLSELRPILEARADELVGAFYRHLLSFSPTRAFLKDPAVKERLLAKQREYLLSLAGPTLDAAYVESRQLIGEVHERIGLEPVWYLGAFSLYFSLLIPIICNEFGDPQRVDRVVVALQKLLTFDAQLAMEAYIDRRERDLEYMADELAREGRRLARDYVDQGAALRHTKERARVAEELASIATLVTGLAHEIGTPMGVIQGHARMLESAMSDEHALWRLKTIQEQITRISRIIQTLLNMARPRKQQRLPVSLEPLIETTLSFLTEKFTRRGIEVSRSYASVSNVQGDAERLQQLLLNLFLNAADAMPEGGELSVDLRESDGGEVEVRIRDSGAGIPTPDLERIFDPFFTTKAAGEGNGLGLMVCKGIVSDHGGSIEVSSRPGEGTTFEILLPAPGREGGAPSGGGI